MKSKTLRLICAVMMLVASADMALAATDRTWNGGTTSTDWSNTGNWQSLAAGRVPDSTGERAVFSTAITRQPRVNNTANGYSIAGIRFASSGWIIGSQLSGNYLKLCGDDGTGVLGVWNNVAGANTIACHIQLVGNNGGTLQWQVDSGGTLTVDSGRVISSTAGSGLEKTSPGTLILTGVNTYTGGTTISGGILQLSGSGQLPSTGTLTMNASTATFDLNGLAQTIGALAGSSGGSITLGTGALTVNQAVGTSFNGIISGGGSLTKSSTGALTLVGANIYTGGTTISGGTLTLSGIDRLATIGTITVSGTGILDLGGSNSQSLTAGGLSVQSGTVQNGTINSSIMYDGQSGTVTANLTGGGSLTKAGAGVLTLSGLNSHTGGTTISGGILNIGAETSLGATAGTLTFNGGTLQFGAVGITLDVSRAAAITASGGYVDTSLNDGSIASAIGGAGGLTKSGTGMLTLSGANSYIGLTTVSNGRLNINSTASGGYAGGVTVSSGAYLGGIGTISGGATINANGHFAPGKSVGAENVGSLTLTSGSILDFEFTDSDNDKIVVANDLILDGTEGSKTFVNVYQEGTTTLFSPTGSGTYNLIQYGALAGTGGTMSLGVSNGDTTHTYTFGISGNWVTLTIDLKTNARGWIGNTDHNWDTAADWDLGVPGEMAPVTFGNASSYPTVTLNSGTANVASMVFNSGTATTITGAGSFSLGTVTGGAGAAISVLGNTHMIDTGMGLNDDATISVIAASGFTVSGTITESSGSKGITKTDSGILTLSGNNSYSGGTTLNAGILNIGEETSLGATAGTVTFNGGTLQFGNAGITLSATRAAAVTTSGGYVDTSLNNGTIDSVIGGSGALTKAGTGIPTLSGNNTHSGGTTLNDGTLNINNNGALGSGTFTIAGGAIDSTVGGITVNNNAQSWAADFAFGGSQNLNLGAGSVALGSAQRTVTVGTGVLTVGGTISGSGSLTKAGTGVLTLSGISTYTGCTTLNAGILNISTDTSLGTTAGTLNFNGGTLQFGAAGITLDASRKGTITASGGFVDTSLNGGTIASVIGGAGQLTKTGGGILILSGANTYSGGTTVNGGTLQLSGSGALATGGTLTVNSSTATFDLNNLARAVGALVGGNGGSITLGTGALTVNQAVTTSFNGIISGAGSLTKSGAGELTLSGANTYTGTTTLSGGTLTLGGGDNRLPSGGTLSLTAASTFGVGSNSQTLSSLTIANGISGTITGSGGTLIINGANFTVGTVNNTTLMAVGLSLKMRGADGVSAAATMLIGGITGSSGDGTVDLTSGVTGSTLNALVGTLTIGFKNIGPGPSPSTASGNFAMGAGLLDADTIVIGKDKEYGSGGTAAGTLSVNGGTVKVRTLKLGDKFGSNTMRGTFNLDGGAILNAGTVQSGNQAGTASVTRTFNWNDGTICNYDTSTDLAINSSSTLTFVLAATGNHAFNIDSGRIGTINVTITGSGAMTKAGAGALTLTGINTYSGVTTVNNGVLSVDAINNGGSAGNLGSVTSAAANLVLAGGTLQYTGSSSSTDRAFTLGVGTTSYIDVTANTLTISGSAAGTSGALTKVGAGTLVLTGANGYIGLTTVGSGILKVDNASGVGLTGNVTVDSSAYLGGSGTISGLVTLQSGGHIAPGNSIGTLNVGSLTLDSGSVLDFEFNADGTSHDQINVLDGSGLTINGGSLNVYAAGGISQWSPPATGIYKLIKYSGALLGSGTISVANQVANFSYTVGTGTFDTDTYLTLQIEAVVPVREWIGNSGTTDWDTAGNWDPALVPGDKALVNFGTQNANASVTLNSGTASLSTVTFRSSVGTTISGTGSFTLNNDSNGAQIIVDPDKTHTINTGVAIADNSTITANGGLTIGGTITGGGGFGVTKAGTGTLTLTGGANSYAGGTTLNAGVLSFGNGALGATGSVTMNGGTLQWIGSNTQDISARLLMVNSTTAAFDTGGNSVTFNNAIGNSTSGILAKSGSGTLTLAAANTYYGATTINGGVLSVSANNNLGDVTTGATVTMGTGTLQLNDSFALDNSGSHKRAFSLTAAGAIDVTGSNTASLTGAISGTGSLTKAGTGTLTLTGANNYSGGTTINAGVLQIGNGSANGTIGSGNYAITSSNARLYLNYGTVSAPTWAKISGAGTLELNVPGTGKDWGAAALPSGFTGALQIDNGRVMTTGSGDQGLGNAANVIVNSGGQLAPALGGTVVQNLTIAGTGSGDSWGVLRLGNQGVTTTVTGSITLSASATIGARGVNGIGYGVINGVISGGSDAVLTVGDTVNIYGSISLNGANTYTGGTTIGGGTLTVSGHLMAGSAGNLGSVTTGTGTLTLGGGVLQYAGNGAQSTTIDRPWKLTASSGIDVTTGNTLTISTAAPSSSSALTKYGTGTLILTGANAYTGATTVGGGKLMVNHAGGVGLAGNVTVNSTATLGGTGTISGAATISSGGALSPGGISSTGTMTIGGALTFVAGSHCAMRIVSNASHDMIVAGGNITLNGATLSLETSGFDTTTSGLIPLISGTVSGITTFSGLSDGSPVTLPNGEWLIRYNSNGYGAVLVPPSGTTYEFQ